MHFLAFPKYDIIKYWLFVAYIVTFCDIYFLLQMLVQNLPSPCLQLFLHVLCHLSNMITIYFIKTGPHIETMSNQCWEIQHWKHFQCQTIAVTLNIKTQYLFIIRFAIVEMINVSKCWFNVAFSALNKISKKKFQCWILYKIMEPRNFLISRKTFWRTIRTQSYWYLLHFCSSTKSILNLGDLQFT